MDTLTVSTSPSSSSVTMEGLGFTAFYGNQWKHLSMKRRPKSVPLRALARLAVMSVRLCRQSMDNLAKQKGEYESVMQVLDEYGAKLNWGGMSFNPKDYRANQQHSLNKGARRLLEIDPNTRNESDINTLLVALRNIPAFAEYPKKMQKKLCQVGRLETYEPRRVILREGDPPSSFYFILSGTVLVTAFEETSGTSRTLVVLNKGMSFGELAVISNTRRQATVCSKTEIELLSISGQEFEEIFMAGGRDVMASEKQKEFIRSVRFLQHWPTNELKGNTQSCSIYYFDRNQVLVRDSNNSDWIYIVLKGSLSVIKKLRTLDPQTDLLLPPKRPKVTFSKPGHRPLPQNFVNKKKGDRSHVSLRKQRRGETTDKTAPDEPDVNINTLPSIWHSWSAKVAETQPRYFKNAMELEHKLEQTLPGYHNNVDRLGSLDYDRIIHEHKGKLIQKSPVMGSKRQADADLDGQRRMGPKSKSNTSVSRLFDHDQEHVTDGQGYQLDVSQREKRPSGENPSQNNILRSSFLPDISLNNKVCRRELSHDGEEITGNERNHEDKEDGNEADTEDRFSASSVESMNYIKSSMRKTRRIRKTSKGVYLAPSKKEPDQEENTQKEEPAVDGTPTKTIREHDNISISSQSHRQDNEVKDETINEKLAKLQIQYQRRIMDGEGRKTIAEELDYKARRDFKFTEADLDPTIIELQGLSSILFPDQPSLSVISNGAECVVMSKKFFLQLASDKCISTLRQTETPYPSDQVLGKKLQEAVNWKASRSAMFRKLQNEILQKQAKRKQYLPSYQGQYCFRTGPT